MNREKKLGLYLRKINKKKRMSFNFKLQEHFQKNM